jgi:hypothetical protein
LLRQGKYQSPLWVVKGAKDNPRELPAQVTVATHAPQHRSKLWPAIRSDHGYPKTRARAQFAAAVSARGMASIHFDVRSIIIKMKLQLLLNCTGPTKSRWQKCRWRTGM